MKKSLLALGVMGTFAGAAHAQNSVTLYGLIDAGITYTNNQSGSKNVQATSGQVNGSRWGLRGSEDLGGGLKAIFTLENGFNIDTGKFGQNGAEFGRQAFVGLSSNQYGAVTLGRQYDSVVDYLGPLALTSTQFGGTQAAHPFDNDNLDNSFRINNSVKYQSVNYGGLKVGGLYGFSNAAGGFSDNRAYSLGTSYNYGPLNVAASYMQLNSGGSTLNTSGAVTTEQGDLAGCRMPEMSSRCCSRKRPPVSMMMAQAISRCRAAFMVLSSTAAHPTLALRIDPPDLPAIELIQISAVAPDRHHDHRADQKPGEAQTPHHERLSPKKNRSAFKCCTDVAAAGPDHLAGPDVPEVVQRDLESGRDNVLVVQPKPDAGVADIAQRTGKNAALLVGEDQRAVRGLYPLNLPSLCHRGLRFHRDGKAPQAKTIPVLALALVEGTLNDL